MSNACDDDNSASLANRQRFSPDKEAQLCRCGLSTAQGLRAGPARRGKTTVNIRLHLDASRCDAQVFQLPAAQAHAREWVGLPHVAVQARGHLDGERAFNLRSPKEDRHRERKGTEPAALILLLMLCGRWRGVQRARRCRCALCGEKGRQKKGNERRKRKKKEGKKAM